MVWHFAGSSRRGPIFKAQLNPTSEGDQTIAAMTLCSNGSDHLEIIVSLQSKLLPDVSTLHHLHASFRVISQRNVYVE
jgi:hypothetical protein